MRDHSRLKAFQLADELVVGVYRATRSFPREEMFGLRAQMRRAALSVVSNIVEGCGRHSRSDYVRFLDIAFGSFRELEYQLSLAHRLNYLDARAHELLRAQCTETSKVLAALIRSLRGKTQQCHDSTP